MLSDMLLFNQTAKMIHQLLILELNGFMLLVVTVTQVDVRFLQWEYAHVS